MAHRLQTKPRAPTTQTFYTKGEVNTEIPINRFTSHKAEPGEAATLIDRNLKHSVSEKQKLPGFYASHLSYKTTNPQSMTELKQFQAQEYAL